MGNGVVKYSKLGGGGGGGVSAVTGTAPIVSSGGATPAISMPVATTSANGYLSSTKWNDFNRKFGGFTYESFFNADEPFAPTAGQAAVFFNPDGEPFELRISNTTYDGISDMSYYFVDNKVGANNLIITNQLGQTTILTLVADAVNNGSYCTINLGIDYFGEDPLSFDKQICNWTFTQNPQLATINGTSLYEFSFFTTRYAMAGNLNGLVIPTGTYFIGIASGTPNATESNRSVAVASGTVTYLYLRISGTMTGTMVVTLMKNGVATAMTFTIATGSAAAIYSTSANQISVIDGDDLSLQMVQTKGTSSTVFEFGFIIT